MGRRGDKDEGGFFDFLSNQASFDYNHDGKIDITDANIEDDFETDWHGFSRRRRARVYAQDEDDEMEKSYKNEFNDDGYEFNEVDEPDDDDELDSDGEPDEVSCESAPGNPMPSEKKERTVATISFEVVDQREERRKKLPQEGAWQFFDGSTWKFIHALFTFDTKLKEDCGDQFEGSEEEIGRFLSRIYAFDKERALADWEWLLKTFPAKTLNSTDKYSYGEPFSCRLGIRVLFILFHEKDNDLLIAFVRQKEVLRYLVVDSVWGKRNEFYLSNLLLCFVDATVTEFARCYESVLTAQKGCYSKVELADAWDSFLYKVDWETLGEGKKTFVREELAKIGDFGKPVLKRIDDIEEEILEAQEYEEEDEDDDNWEEKEQETIRTLEEMTIPVLEKIENGELFDEAYKTENTVLNYCFGSGNRARDCVARSLLKKNGEIVDVSNDLQCGKIPSSDIETIYMLTVAGLDILDGCKAKYGSVQDKSIDAKRIEINKPIVEFICRYYYPAKLMQLEAYGSSLGILYDESPVLKKAYDTYQDYASEARDRVQSIFKTVTPTDWGKTKIADEKRLFTYSQLNYPDAVFKYHPNWGEGLYFDVYIPSLRLIIEYRKHCENAADEDKEQKKFEQKRKLCGQRRITFMAWESDVPINEANFLQLIDGITKNKGELK